MTFTNNMIPVPDNQIINIGINKEKNPNHKYLLQAESREVNRQKNRIRKNAEIVYSHKKHNGKKTALAKRTNDFEMLEKLCNSMEIINTILHPVFTMAVRDGYIRTNPSDGVMAEIKKSHNWEKPKRHVLTQQQQALFINFLAESEIYNHWLPLMTVFLGTGCRVGEVNGLTWDDCDFKEGIISINHNLIYRQQDDGKCEMHITTPKTEAGKRIVPMFEAVRKALLQEKKQQMKHGFNSTVIDGYSGFVFTNRCGYVHNPQTINRAIKRIYKACNEQETERAKKEHRQPVLIPHFSVHNLRHTFCTRLAKEISLLVYDTYASRIKVFDIEIRKCFGRL